MTFSELVSEIQSWTGTVLEFKLFEINETPITPATLLTFVVVILAFFLFSRLVFRTAARRLLSRFGVDQAIAYNMTRVSHYLILAIGTIVAFQFVGIDLSALAVVFGFLSVGIGFGLQNIASNFVSGLILLFERPISVGDRVTVGDLQGDVIAIRMRATTVRSLNNITIIVPNSEFVQSNVINWSVGDAKIRLDLDVGVSYSSDLQTVLTALREVAAEYPKALKNPAPEVLLLEFGDSSWDMQLRIWIADPRDFWTAKSEINCAIVEKFRERDIEIPFPQRDLHLRSPLPVPVGNPDQA